MEFYIPTQTGELLAFSSACVTALVGLVMLFAPGLTFRLLGLQPRETRSGAYAEARSWGGFNVGLALTALLVAQTWVYLALGGAFALAVFGRILSMMSDGANTMWNWLFLTVQIVLAILPLAYVFGFI